MKGRSFKLCMIITLLRVYQLTAGRMTSTLFQGLGFVKVINCTLLFCMFYFYILVCCASNVVWLLHVYINKIKHSMLCMTDVCKRMHCHIRACRQTHTHTHTHTHRSLCMLRVNIHCHQTLCLIFCTGVLQM